VDVVGGALELRDGADPLADEGGAKVADEEFCRASIKKDCGDFLVKQRGGGTV
jgi:hypothetical protein